MQVLNNSGGTLNDKTKHLGFIYYQPICCQQCIIYSKALLLEKNSLEIN